MALTWISVSARTGAVFAELPELAVDWPLKRTIGRAEAATAHLPLYGNCPTNWQEATQEGGAVLIALEAGVPAWGGLVVEADESNGPRVDLSLATIESYFDRRFVGDITYSAGQNTIVADLINRYVLDGASGLAGLPIVVRTVTAGTGATRTRTYADADDATVLSRLQQLMGIQGGPEWSVEWEWTTDRRRIVPVLSVGDRIGTAATPGLRPSAWFDLPGCVTEAHLVRSYAAGKGANLVLAVSSGQSGARPTSGSIVSPNPAGRPTYEYRYTPSTSITDVNVLKGHARSALAVLANGSRALTMTAAVGGSSPAPRLGVDFQIGDDIGYLLSGPAWPNGLRGAARCIAWERTDRTVTPILAVTEVEVEDTS